MIKIITKGTRKRITCEECGCYFSYDQEDVKEVPADLTGGYTVRKHIVACPQCEVPVYVDEVTTK